MSYVPVKFEVAMSNGLRGDSITRNVMDICTYALTDDRPTLV